VTHAAEPETAGAGVPEPARRIEVSVDALFG
jgi:hypothetical protein